MGVPKFYRWISERYPCLSETVKEYQIPEFDNLYLDMNGIIHNCSHPNDDDVHFRISEEKIIEDIFHYLEVLFRLIRPQKVFFMAIDGVAPRAKMNQQRGRRFRSAKEAEDKEKEALRKGEVLPDEKRFDSNCITPGTEFMDALQKQLQYFVTKKVSTDPLWQKTQVILSGHQVPGEGEHKIMEFIRYQRSQPDYNVDTRHCLYGLDADLIMLGLCSHEPYFSLLREEVRFGGKKNEKRVTTPEETTFHLLHLSLMREYLDIEFSALKTTLKFPYNLENIIDDWVLMGFLVGNDFIPHLPHFHINKGALPMLYEVYLEVLPTLDGYLNENGLLNLPRFEKFIERLSKIDYTHFDDVYADVKWLESRHGRKKLVEYESSVNAKQLNPFKLPTAGRSSETTNFLLAKAAEVDELLKDDEFAVAPDDLEGEESGEEEYEDEEVSDVSGDDESYTASDEDKQYQAEFKAHKRNYYMEKLEYNEVDSDVLRDQAEGYIRAIQWILHYYYNGVASWSWFYPHHYAPYVSDIRNFANLDLTFNQGKPFLPYEQLLGVLPAASKALLPPAHHSLMSSTNSPIIEFYPSNFVTDKNGKQQEWEAVVLIPFIDEKRLISAMADCENRLSDQERQRNQHGPMQVYIYTDTDLGQYNAPGYFAPVPHNHCQCQELTRDAFVIPPERLVKGLHPRFNLERYIPGFPSIRHLPIKSTLKKSSICVFQMATLNESQILTLSQESVPEIDEIGPRYCGQSVFVSWPHLMEARVVAVASLEFKYSFEIDSYCEGGGVNYKLDGGIRKTPMTQKDAAEWQLSEKEIRTRYANRWGIDIGQTHILLYAMPIIGRKYVYTQSGRVTLEKQWSMAPMTYALQATVKDLKVKETIGHQYSTVAEVFPNNSTCFMLGHPGYGLQGRVLSADKNLKGKIRIEFEHINEPDSEEVKKLWTSVSSRYMPGHVGAQRLGISPLLLSRITGTIFVQVTPVDDPGRSGDRPRRPKKINVGLGLKFNKANEEVPGWSRKNENLWLYSVKTIEVVRRFITEFPDLFDFLSRFTNADDFSDVQLFGPDCAERVAQLQEFLQSLPCHNAERQPCGMASVDADTIPLLLKHPPKLMKLKPMVMLVRPHLLYKPDLSSGSSPPDPSAYYQLLDRIVNTRQGFSVPLGLRGTVTGIKKAKKTLDVVYEILFDQEFADGLPIRGLPGSAKRMYNLPAWAMINLTHGMRQYIERERQGKPTAVVRPSGSAVKEAARNPPRQNQSYKAAVDQQPKLLTRQKIEVKASAAVPCKKAPSPSALPSPFMDIWNSLLQQHEEQQQPVKQQKPRQKSGKTQVVAPQQTVRNQQQKPKEPAIPNAPKLPTLQEAARNLPKITKTPTGSPAAAPAPVQLVPPAAVPIGPSLSVQQLFDMAGAMPLVPVMPRPPVPHPLMPQVLAPPVFSYCLQLMDLAGRKGLGPPFYNYMRLQDGSMMAEVSVANFGVVGRCAAKTKEEAAEMAASIALRHPMIFSPIVPNYPHYPGNVMMIPPPAMPQHVVNRGPVPNSFVPMQVTRQSVQTQPRPVVKPAVKQQEEAIVTPIKQVEPPTTPVAAQPMSTAKPPGSRLAIRFNGP